MGERAGHVGAIKDAEATHDDHEPVISPEHDEVWDLAEIQRMRADFQTGRNVKTDTEVIPNLRPRYTLDELLAKCDAGAEISVEDREWLETHAVGDELL
jgi:antitoxin ChpS